MLFRLGLRYACFSWVVLGAGCAAIVRGRGLALEHDFSRHGLQHEILEVDGAQLEYWVGGSGVPVVLLHGFGPPAPWQWGEQVDALNERHRLLVPNLLWFGASRDLDAHAIDLERQIDVLAQLMESLRFRDAVVVGASYGGIVGYGLAIVRPDLVGRLVLVDSPGMNFEPRMYTGILERHGVSDVAKLFVPSDARGVQRLLDIGYWDPPSVPASMRRAVAEVLYDDRRAEKTALLRDLAGRLQTDTTDTMRTGAATPVPSQPTLVVWGRDDTVFPLWIGAALARRLGAELLVIPRARHSPNIEHPEVFNRSLVQWIAETSKPGSLPVGRSSPG